MDLKAVLLNYYPVPIQYSIWGTDNVTTKPISDLDLLLSAGVQELASDVFVTDYVSVSSMNTSMPDDCVMVYSAKLIMAFQGNRLVKFTYDKGRNVCSVKYFPATITYKRKLRLDDFTNDLISGDLLRMCEDYFLWRMASKELNVLNMIKLDNDNGQINLEALGQFANNKKEEFDKFKEEILIYAGTT